MGPVLNLVEHPTHIESCSYMLMIQIAVFYYNFLFFFFAVCEYYCHVHCLDFVVSNCIQYADYDEKRELVSDVI